MRPYAILCCALALYAPIVLRAQDTGEDVSEDGAYDDDFQEEDQGPRSVAEARAQGRAYRIGTAMRKPDRDVHVVQSGDTLWDLSERYYGDPYHWPELWSFNPEITNPHWIYPLDQIRLTMGTLTSDQAQQAAQQAAGADPSGLVEPKQGLLTELAPRVTVSPKLLKPETLFLRDEAYLDDDAIKAAGQVVGGNEEQMFLSDSDEAYLKFKQGQDVRTGQPYTVYREIDNAERYKEEKGRLVRILGTIVVRSYDRETGVARGLVTETIEPIERGLYVASMERRFDLVPPKRNDVNVVAHVLASAQSRRLLSYGNLVFLDVGEGHGIQPGNRFFAVRRGDNWMEVLQRPAKEMGNVADVPAYDREQLPKEVVAELRVVKVRKKVTIALVTRSDTDLALGETVEMRQGF